MSGLAHFAKQISELQRGLESGAFTSVDLVAAYLARIEEVNHKGPQLNAVIATSPVALSDAAKLDALRQKGHVLSPLHGIPILLKDNIATRVEDGMDTTAGSYALVGAKVQRDARLAQLLVRPLSQIMALLTVLSARERCHNSRQSQS